MKQLPTGWSRHKLGDLIELKYGVALPKKARTNNGPPVLGSNGRIGEHTPALTDGETLIIGRKGSIGEVHYSPMACTPIDTTYYIDNVPDNAFRYWFYSLKNLNLDRLNKSTAIPGLSRNDVYDIDTPVPPINEQRRIADKLDRVLACVDGANEHLSRVAPLIKRFRQSVLAAATSGRLTEDTSTTSRQVMLQDVALDFSYGSSEKSKPHGKVPVLRMGNIQGGSIDWSDLVFTDNESEIAKYELTYGDVLFNRTNSPELVGKTAIYDQGPRAIYAGYLIRIKCTEELNPFYLNYCLNSPMGRAYCWSVKSDGVSQSNINAKKLAAFSFRLPSIEEQSEIVRRVEKLFAFADRLEERLSQAQAAVQKLTPALLAKAFRGELVPQDPNDEPASELLKRLQESRAESAKASRARKPRTRKLP